MLIPVVNRQLWACILGTLFLSATFADDHLIEAESFDDLGGWKLDTQFIDTMGSPYLLAHGLGQPVANAKTTISISESGRYRVFVRTMDWVGRWRNNEKQTEPRDRGDFPGRFKLRVGGQPLTAEFGTHDSRWSWHDGGSIELEAGKVTLELVDQTGFDGRCDAIWLTRDQQSTPPNENEILSKWRRQQLGLPADPETFDGYDLVVVGGGYSGMGAALSAARMGCRVALIQNRGVLGGNGSSEVRVWSQGLIKRGRFPRIGEIVEEFADKAKKSPGTYAEFGDSHKQALVESEKNIDLFLWNHAYRVDTSDSKIDAVHTFDTRTSKRRKFVARNFVDCTGHGTIGFLAKAEWEMTEKGRMGMSNMWAWAEREQATPFPETPWALDLTMKDFPYPRDHHGQWFWESGFDIDPIREAEAIRDWNLRAVYGAFNAMKNRGGKAKHEKAVLTWVAYIGGPRESRRLKGDVMLNQEDIVTKRDFSDGCVPSTWSIDLHYPKKQYAKKFPDNPFISIAEHDRRVDREFGYPIPYRCFYSRNIENLFMAGRCISVTHQALGTVRVMKTCGMMGEVVGKAAAICAEENCSPRQVFHSHWPRMEKMLTLPGTARRKSVHDPLPTPPPDSADQR